MQKGMQKTDVLPPQKGAADGESPALAAPENTAVLADPTISSAGAAEKQSSAVMAEGGREMPASVAKKMPLRGGNKLTRRKMRRCGGNKLLSLRQTSARERS